MAITKDQLAQLNFGYINGQDLLQFCPIQLLTSVYEKFPDLLKSGCDMAYDEVKGELCTRYDINKEISNANQIIKDKTGQHQVNIVAGTYISRIYFRWNSPIKVEIDGDVNNNVMQLISNGILSPIMGSIIDISPAVTVGTTLNGNDIMTIRNVSDNGLVFWVNKIFATDTVLYFHIINGNVDIELSANSGVSMPPISVIGLQNKSDAFTISIPANSYIYQIFPNILLSTPSIKIGTTEGGEEVVAEVLVSNAIIPLLIQYFAIETILYVTISGGSVNMRIDIGYNFVAPTPSPKPLRNAYLVKLLSIFAIRNILGSLAGDNKQLIGLFDWADTNIIKIKKRDINLDLYQTPQPLRGNNEVVNSNFRTLG